MIIDRALIPRANLIRALSIQGVSLLSDLIPPDSEPGISLRQNFYSSLDSLLKLAGPQLEEFHVGDSRQCAEDEGGFKTRSIDGKRIKLLSPTSPSSKFNSHTLSTSIRSNTSGDGLFSEAHKVLGSVAQYCKNLKRISLAGSEDSDYVGDSNILMLTMCCPFVQEFRDAEEFGVSPEAIKHMVDGWKDLVSLEINTECTDLSAFSSSVSLFGARLKRLAVTHFKDPLSSSPLLRRSSNEGNNDEVQSQHQQQQPASGFDMFLSVLRRLVSLEVLAIDLSVTRHQDGISAADMSLILESCPHLKGFEYFAPIEAYFDDTDDSLDDYNNCVYIVGTADGDIGETDYCDDGSSSLRSGVARSVGSRLAITTGADERSILSGGFKSKKRWDAASDSSISSSLSKQQHQLSKNDLLSPCQTYSADVDTSRRMSMSSSLNVMVSDDLDSKSDRGGSASAGLSLSIISTDDADSKSRDDEDVTSMMPAIPSPTDAFFASSGTTKKTGRRRRRMSAGSDSDSGSGRHLMDLYGSWDSADRCGLKERVAKAALGRISEDEEAATQIFEGKVGAFFEELERVGEVCLARGVRLNLGWSL